MFSQIIEREGEAEEDDFIAINILYYISSHYSISRLSIPPQLLNHDSDYPIFYDTIIAWSIIFFIYECLLKLSYLIKTSTKTSP